MHRTLRGLIVVTVLVGAFPGIGRAEAEENPWRVRLGVVGAEATAGGGDPSYGVGLGLEYRMTPHLGLELAALSTKPTAEASIDFLPEASLKVESSFRMTPVMLALDVHLTPHARADFHVAPIAAYVRMSPLTVRLQAFDRGQEFTEVTRIELDDQLTLGLALGVDLPVGDRSFLAIGATYLDLPLSATQDELGFGRGGGIDPLLVQASYGVRF